MRLRLLVCILLILFGITNVGCTSVKNTNETRESKINASSSEAKEETNESTADCEGTYGVQGRWFLESNTGILSLSNDYEDSETIDYKIGEAPWNEYSSQIKEVEIYANYIGDNYFYNCKNLKKIYFNREVTSISDKAFIGCDNIEIVITDFDNKIIKNFAIDNGYQYMFQDSNSTALTGE